MGNHRITSGGSVINVFHHFGLSVAKCTHTKTGGYVTVGVCRISRPNIPAPNARLGMFNPMHKRSCSVFGSRALGVSNN